MSSKRYTLSELNALLRAPEVISFAIRCSDKFGDYGIIGFATVMLVGKELILKDFLLSCRVAQKKVEHAFIRYLAELLRNKGFSHLKAEITKTTKNYPLIKVFEDLPFQTITEETSYSLLEMDLSTKFVLPKLIEIYDKMKNNDFTGISP